jgi:hypothetical protein
MSCRLLYEGYTSALVQAIPTNITLFSVYTFTKTHAQDLGLMDSPQMDLITRLVCSMAGTYAAVLVTAPIDIARTFRQELLSAPSPPAHTTTPPPSINLPPITMSTSGSSLLPHLPMSTGIPSGSAATPPIPSTWTVLKNIYREHGLRRIYAGATARLVSSAPYTVAMLIGYDYVKIYSMQQEL